MEVDGESSEVIGKNGVEVKRTRLRGLPLVVRVPYLLSADVKKLTEPERLRRPCSKGAGRFSILILQYEPPLLPPTPHSCVLQSQSTCLRDHFGATNYH